MVIRSNEIPTGRIESYDNLQQGVNESRARLGAEAAMALSSPPEAITRLPEVNQSKIGNSNSAIDANKTPQELVNNRIFVDKQQQSEAPEKLESTERKVPPKVSVELQDLSKEQKDRPDFVVKKNGEIEMWRNPEAQANPEIKVVLERSEGQINPTPEQVAKANELVKYLSERTQKQNPEASEKGVEIDDKSGVISRDTRKSGNLSTPSSLSGVPEPTQQRVQEMNRFSGSNGGEMPVAKTNDYFPTRDVPRQLNESDKQAATKEAVAGLFNPDKSSPYETMRKVDDGSYRVGRYGISGEQLSNFLSGLGEPPDPALIDKLVKSGRLPKDFAEKLKNPEFLSKLKQFAKKLDGGTEPVTKQELATFLPKDVQEGLATVLVDQMKAKVGDNPGAIAAGLLSGKAPDKITQADMNSPQAKQLSQAGERLYEMAEARQQSKSSDDTVKWDSAGRMSIGDGKWLEGKAGEALKRAQEQARAAGIDIQINSAGRTYQEQSALYARLNGVSPVARPGTSNHESGRALDIQNYEQAKPFLVANGFVHGDGNGPIANDLVHFKYVG